MRTGRAVGAWVLGFAITLAGCASKEPLLQSTTSPYADDPSASRDPSLLLTAADLAAVGYTGATTKDLTELGAFENPDPRGPCGANVPLPPPTGRYGRAFTGYGFAMAQTVQPVSAATSAVIDASKADARPGCGPFTSRTNQGLAQHVSDITILDLPGCERCLGFTATFTVEGRPGFVGGLLYEEGGVMGMVQLMAESPVPARAMVELLGRATQPRR